jgi:hypothetical protein
MNYLRCPQIDQLGRELIEAYRQVGDTDTFSRSECFHLPTVLLNIHHKLAEHRRACYLCSQLEANRTDYLSSRVPSPTSGPGMPIAENLAHRPS